MAVDTGDPAGNETNTDSHLTDEEAGAQRGHTARKGQSLEVTLCSVCVPYRAPGPSPGNALAGVEKLSERGGLCMAESGSDQQDQP